MDGDNSVNITALQLLEQKMGLFTIAQRKVADYVLKHPTEVAFLTIDQLARLIGTSVATVMRMTYVLGYTGYSQFQKELQVMLVRSQISPPIRLEANVKKVGSSNLLLKCAELQINNIKKIMLLFFI